MSEGREKALDDLLNMIRVWIETESGPTRMTISHQALQTTIKFHGYKKLILERKFEDSHDRGH